MHHSTISCRLGALLDYIEMSDAPADLVILNSPRAMARHYKNEAYGWKVRFRGFPFGADYGCLDGYENVRGRCVHGKFSRTA
jgi:hypothetical protein